MPAILLVKVADAPVAESPTRWKGGQVVDAFSVDHVFGDPELPAAGKFYHITITNPGIGVDEAREYLEEWRHKPTYEVLGRQGNVRRIRVTSSMVSVSGKNAFERAPIEAFFGRWNATYVSHNQNSFTMDADIDDEYFDEARADMDKTIMDMQYARRRWYITPAGMTFLANNSGSIERTASQIQPFLRDGLLD